MNLSPIADIITLLTAISGLVGAIYSLLTGFSKRRTKPTEISPLKFFRIWRQQVEVKVWKDLKRTYLATVLIYVVVIAIITASLVLSPSFFHLSQIIKYSIYFIALIVSIYNILIFTYLYFDMGSKPEDARTFLFQHISVEVEADFDEIFNQCQQALKHINAQIVDLNYFEHHLEANIAVSLQSPGGLLVIQINPTENNRHSIQASMKQRFSLFRATVNSSWVMNLFVEQLMGK